MRLAPSGSARGVALAVAFCALGIAGGCGRETFDLLPNDAPESSGVSAGAGSNSGGAGNGGAGRAGAGGASAGGAGKAGAGGSGGRFGSSGGGGLGNFPCLGEAGCPDEVPFCPPYGPNPFCVGCFTNKDCLLAGDAKDCDPDLKRCVQCRRDPDCSGGEVCNTLTQRCLKACDRKDDCVVDSQHMLCDPERHMCVSCIRDTDCESGHCFLYACLECSKDGDCGGMMSQSCVAGHCTVKH